MYNFDIMLIMEHTICSISINFYHINFTLQDIQKDLIITTLFILYNFKWV